MNGKHIFLAAVTALVVAVTGCGGNGDTTSAAFMQTPMPPPVTPPPAEPKAVTFTDFSTAGSDAPVFSASNRNGDQVDYYGNQDDSGQLRLSQVVMSSKAGITARTFYDSNGEISRINDEKTGEFIIVSPLDNGQRLLAYRADGSYQGGMAILTNADGTHSVAPVTGAPVFKGQLQISLNGSPSQSASLVADSMAGLGKPEPLPANLEAFLNNFSASSKSGVRSKAGFNAAKALTNAGITTWATIAVIGTAGVLTGTFTIPVALASVALVGAATGVVGYLHDRANQQLDNAFEQYEQSFYNETTTAFSEESTPETIADKARKFVKDIIDRGAAAAQNTAADVRQTVGDASTTLRSSFADEASEQVATSEPPAVTADLEGFGVDQGNTSYQYSGSIAPDGSIRATGTAQSGAKTTITGSLNGNTVSGNWASTAMDGSAQGSGTVAGEAQTFGACETVQNAGEQGTFSVAYNLGAGGTASFSYQAFNIPDAFTVRNGGTQVFSTNGLVSGSGGGDFALTSSTVFVNVSAPNDDTAWEYFLSCAR